MDETTPLDSITMLIFGVYTYEGTKLWKQVRMDTVELFFFFLQKQDFISGIPDKNGSKAN